MVWRSATTTTVSASAGPKKVQVARKAIPPDPPGTISGATNPDAIPDAIAFELFMRSISDYPSEQSFRDLGLNEGQIQQALNYRASFEQELSLMDEAARNIRETRRGMEQLAQLQKKKENFIERSMKQTLRDMLGDEGANKIRSNINARVKPKTKRITTITAKKTEDDREVAEPVRARRSARHHPAAVMPSEQQVYVFSNAWKNGGSVYGSGTLSSSYQDFSQYLVTTTVVAPNGTRWSTSQTGWDYSSVSNSEYMDIWPNDGTFTVESVFQGTNGYFISSFNAVVVVPQISVSGAVAVPPLVNVNGTVEITALISFTQGVPAGTTALIELNETVNFNAITYTVHQILNFLLIYYYYYDNEIQFYIYFHHYILFFYYYYYYYYYHY
jgi:hypothetical protein